MDDDKTPQAESNDSDTRQPDSKADILKYRLSIAGVIISILLFVFMMFSDAVFNFQCPVIDFVTFQCNRFDGTFKSWE